LQKGLLQYVLGVLVVLGNVPRQTVDLPLVLLYQLRESGIVTAARSFDKSGFVEADTAIGRVHTPLLDSTTAGQQSNRRISGASGCCGKHHILVDERTGANDSPAPRPTRLFFNNMSSF